MYRQKKEADTSKETNKRPRAPLHPAVQASLPALDVMSSFSNLPPSFLPIASNNVCDLQQEDYRTEGELLASCLPLKRILL